MDGRAIAQKDERSFSKKGPVRFETPSNHIRYTYFKCHQFCLLIFQPKKYTMFFFLTRKESEDLRQQLVKDLEAEKSLDAILSVPVA